MKENVRFISEFINHFIAMLLYLIGLVSSAQYAFLYCGSRSFFNYRHQADIFTIYQQLLQRGFTASNIGLYAYDDIATSYENPFPGQVFHTLDHKVNVYPGSSAINVKGRDVDPDAFDDAITNLPTTINDYVFIYYDNHGGPGYLGTPVDAFLDAEEINESLTKASDSKLYKQVLFIIEACYSGSVGEQITAPNVAIITAANSEESSYAAVFDAQVGAYLSNEFTNYFISMIDESPEINVGQLYDGLKEQTTKSHVCFFGDESIKSVPISFFIGKPNRILFKKVKKFNSDFSTSSESTEKTLKYLSQHSKTSIRARARLQLLKLKAQTEKLEIVLELLVKYVDPANYEKIMNDRKSKITPTYFKVLKVFCQKFGEINPDDYGRFNVIKALAATHSKAEIIQGIFAVLI